MLISWAIVAHTYVGLEQLRRRTGPTRSVQPTSAQPTPTGESYARLPVRTRAPALTWPTYQANDQGCGPSPERHQTMLPGGGWKVPSRKHGPSDSNERSMRSNCRCTHPTRLARPIPHPALSSTAPFVLLAPPRPHAMKTARHGLLAPLADRATSGVQGKLLALPTSGDVECMGQFMSSCAPATCFLFTDTGKMIQSRARLSLDHVCRQMASHASV